MRARVLRAAHPALAGGSHVRVRRRVRCDVPQHVSRGPQSHHTQARAAPALPRPAGGPAAALPARTPSTQPLLDARAGTTSKAAARRSTCSGSGPTCSSASTPRPSARGSVRACDAAAYNPARLRRRRHPGLGRRTRPAVHDARRCLPQSLLGPPASRRTRRTRGRRVSAGTGPFPPQACAADDARWCVRAVRRCCGGTCRRTSCSVSVHRCRVCCRPAPRACRKSPWRRTSPSPATCCSCTRRVRRPIAHASRRQVVAAQQQRIAALESQMVQLRRMVGQAGACRRLMRAGRCGSARRRTRCTATRTAPAPWPSIPRARASSPAPTMASCGSDAALLPQASRHVPFGRCGMCRWGGRHCCACARAQPVSMQPGRCCAPATGSLLAAR